MPHYKLTYFNLRARGELIRMVLAVAGVEYEDKRIEYADWASVKSSTPTLFGQLPVINIDGVDYCQSYAIGRYLAKLHGLAGKTDIEQLRADMVVACTEDAIAPVPIYMFHTSDESIKEKLKKRYLEEQVPVFLTNLDKILLANNDGNGYWVGDSLTWADLAFLCLTEWLEVAGAADQLAAHPKLVAVKQRVQSIPKVAEWLAMRPKTFV